MELTTWPMFALAIIGACVQATAHVLMYGRETTRVERYTVGMAVLLTAFSIGWTIEPQGNPIVGIWLCGGVSGVTVWMCYHIRAVQEQHVAQEQAARLIGRLEREFSDDVPDAHPRD